jgi:hypothetical protein
VGTVARPGSLLLTADWPRPGSRRTCTRSSAPARAATPAPAPASGTRPPSARSAAWTPASVPDGSNLAVSTRSASKAVHAVRGAAAPFGSGAEADSGAVPALARRAPPGPSRPREGRARTWCRGRRPRRRGRTARTPAPPEARCPRRRPPATDPFGLPARMEERRSDGSPSRRSGAALLASDASEPTTVVARTSERERRDRLRRPSTRGRDSLADTASRAPPRRRRRGGSPARPPRGRATAARDGRPHPATRAPTGAA